MAEKIGAGEARLRELNPRLIYCAISGFGPDGPAAARPSYDTVAQAASGFLKLLVNPANPRVVGPGAGRCASPASTRPTASSARSTSARSGSRRTGRRVEVSMFEAMTHFNLDAFTHLFSEGEVMGPYSRPSVSQSYVLPCADGKWIALHMSSPPKFWQGLAQAIEKPDLFDDPRFADREARIRNQELLIELLSGLFRERERAEWCRRLEALDVPHAPMYDTNEVPDDPQARHLQLFVDAPHPAHPDGERWRSVRSPLSFDGERALEVEAPPLLGSHDEWLRSGASPWAPAKPRMTRSGAAAPMTRPSMSHPPRHRRPVRQLAQGIPQPCCAAPRGRVDAADDEAGHRRLARCSRLRWRRLRAGLAGRRGGAA